jgi:predicted PurR-regulated permease PerM
MYGPRTATGINVALGTAMGFILSLIGMPNPVLWGVMMGTFNFVPYVGPFASMIVLTLVGVTTFDSIGGALLAVPMLATLKIFCDEIKPLAAVAEFLGP